MEDLEEIPEAGSSTSDDPGNEEARADLDGISAASSSHADQRHEADVAADLDAISAASSSTEEGFFPPCSEAIVPHRPDSEEGFLACVDRLGHHDLVQDTVEERTAASLLVEVPKTSTEAAASLVQQDARTFCGTRELTAATGYQLEKYCWQRAEELAVEWAKRVPPAQGRLVAYVESDAYDSADFVVNAEDSLRERKPSGMDANYPPFNSQPPLPIPLNTYHI